MAPAHWIRLFLILVSIGVALITGRSPADAQDARFVRIGTGPIGGTYFPIGGLIANIISGPPGAMACDAGGSCGVPGLIATAVSTQGSAANVRDLETGATDLALCQADVAHDAFSGTAAYAGKPIRSLRAIASLFTEAVHVVVGRDAGIDDVAQLKGKRVAVGETASGTIATTKVVLRGYGLEIKELKPVYEKLARAADMLSVGELDAFFMVGGVPVAAIANLAERAPVRLVPIAGKGAERILKAEPYYQAIAVPDNAYRGVPATPTLGVSAQLLVRADLPDDLVYAITGALWNPGNRKLLDLGHPNGRRIRRESALEGLAVPLHPGAERYYRDNPVLPVAERP